MNIFGRNNRPRRIGDHKHQAVVYRLVGREGEYTLRVVDKIFQTDLEECVPIIFKSALNYANCSEELNVGLVSNSTPHFRSGWSTSIESNLK